MTERMADTESGSSSTNTNTNNRKNNSHASNHKGWVFLGVGAVLVVVAAVVVVVVLVAGGGSDDLGSVTTDPAIGNSTTAPTRAPAPSPPSPWDTCFDSVQRLVNTMRSRKDYATFVDVEICPNSLNRIDSEKPDHKPYAGTNPGLNAQSNMRIKCGPNGDPKNNCILQGEAGYFVLTNSYWSFMEPEVKNFTVEGLTMRDPSTILRMLNGGDVTFRNCVFQVSVPCDLMSTCSQRDCNSCFGFSLLAGIG